MNEKEKTRLWNIAYKKGFEDAISFYLKQLSSSNKLLCEKFSAQFEGIAEKPIDIEPMVVTEGVESVFGVPKFTKFYAETMAIKLEISPNKEGYATWSNIKEKERLLKK